MTANKLIKLAKLRKSITAKPGSESRWAGSHRHYPASWIAGLRFSVVIEILPGLEEYVKKSDLKR